MFLTIEGIEGVGKSTAIQFIQKYLTDKNIPFVLTREPGGTEIAENIRKILLTPNQNEKVFPLTELLLMFASRSQHVQQVILPALQKNQWVISDRFVDASFAYQGGGREIEFSKIEQLAEWTVGNIKPDQTILLDASPEIGLARAKHRGPQDRIEQEKLDFFERVRQAYLLRAKQDPKRFIIIDATQSLSTVQDAIRQVLDHWM